MNNNEWYKEWFASNFYQIVYKHRDDKDASLLLSHIIKILNLETNSYILDAACGTGRHLNILKNLGFNNIFGFDLSLPLLKETKKRGINNIINADIRNIFFNAKFDVVLNIFTSFGYFADDYSNFLFFKNVKNFLKLNGYLVFDYFNSNFLKNNLIPFSQNKIDNFEISEHRTIENDRVEKLIEISDDTNVYKYKESVKLYTPDFLEQKFIDLGYKIITKFGNYDGESFNNDVSPRLIIILENEKI